MATNRMRRIGKELNDIHKDHQSSIQAQALSEDMTRIQASFRGPPDTPYEGGIFKVGITIPPEYPFKPPIMKFETKLWHPNVSSQTGAICLDTLGTAWSPVLTIKSALLSLQSLLSTPEPKDPQDAEVASMLIRHPEQFAAKAREWAVAYAGAPRKETQTYSQGYSSSMQPHAQKSKEQQAREEAASYMGYNKDLIDRFVNMGFDVDRVVAAFQAVGIDEMEGEDYELEEAYMGDITAYLVGEP